jgi:hypothetical protein
MALLDVGPLAVLADRLAIVYGVPFSVFMVHRLLGSAESGAPVDTPMHVRVSVDWQRERGLRHSAQ